MGLTNHIVSTKFRRLDAFENLDYVHQSFHPYKVDGCKRSFALSS
jgi:hypothetical protein